jgi:hypothetical protein
MALLQPKAFLVGQNSVLEGQADFVDERGIGFP